MSGDTVGIKANDRKKNIEIEIKEAVEAAINRIFEATHPRHPLNCDPVERRCYLVENLARKPLVMMQFMQHCSLIAIPKNERWGISILDIGPAEGVIPRALHNMGFRVSVLVLTCINQSNVS